jgi:hypothetical protein
LAETPEQKAASYALERALVRIVKAYGLVSDSASVVDYLEAYHGICAEIMGGAFMAVREAANVESPAEARRGARPPEKGLD